MTAASSVENLSSGVNKFEDVKFNEFPRFIKVGNILYRVFSLQ